MPSFEEVVEITDRDLPHYNRIMEIPDLSLACRCRAIYELGRMDRMPDDIESKHDGSLVFTWYVDDEVSPYRDETIIDAQGVCKDVSNEPT